MLSGQIGPTDNLGQSGPTWLLRLKRTNGLSVQSGPNICQAQKGQSSSNGYHGKMD